MIKIFLLQKFQFYDKLNFEVRHHRKIKESKVEKGGRQTVLFLKPFVRVTECNSKLF